jgi:hypothetical protein
VGIFGLIYLCLVPLVIYWLRPRPVAKGKSIKKSENLIHAVYTIIRNFFILFVPRLFAAEYEDNSTLDLVKANEAQLVKGNYFFF